MPRHALTRLLSISLLLLLAPTAVGQISLSGSGTYLENFDGIGGGLPTGWTVRTNADATSLGIDGSAGFNTFTVSWGTTAGQFANYASALNPGADGTQLSTTQAGYPNRAVGIRQLGAFGDPGAAFTLQLANTTGFQDFNLSVNLQTLTNSTTSPRVTTYTIRYAVGTPSVAGDFTTLGTYTTDDNFSNATQAFDLSGATALNNQGQSVWFQVVALSASTGSGNRDTFAIDNFQLTYTPVPEPGTVLAVAAAGLGLAGLVRWRRPTP
jgi:hypothetical protein